MWKRRGPSLTAVSQAEGGSEQGAEAGEQQQAGQARVSRWSEHVWSTFIHRGYSDDVTERQEEVCRYVDTCVDICRYMCR